MVVIEGLAAAGGTKRPGFGATGSGHATDMPTRAAAECPKHMVFGPCGGVRPDLSCEMAPQPCPFAVVGEVVAWRGPTPEPGRGAQLLAAAATRPVVLTDLTTAPYDAAGTARIAGELAGACDAVLVGEHHNRPDLPPTVMTGIVRDAGVPPWITLTCRDRNRIVLEQEIAGLAVAGADGVLCVTGDGRAPGVRSGVTQVFDLDGTRLAALAAAAGLPVAVPESPDAAPRALRPARLLQKQRAGASVAVLNGVGSVDRLARFVDEARSVGVTLPLIAGVAVFTDDRSAAVLRAFPGLGLDEARVAAVLGARDPVEAGVRVAVEAARAILAVDGVVGVNLSGLASDRGVEFAASVKARVGRELIGGLR